VRMTNRIPLSGLLSRLVLGTLLSCGCQLLGHDQARCDQSVATVRQAISLGDFESARSWRNYTWKVCDERGVIATLDKEIVDGETALVTAQTAKQAARALAQSRINQAQAAWRKFDAQGSAERTRDKLEETRQSAKAQAQGLTPEYAQKLDAYNSVQYEQRLKAIP
jgi:hypothetical protein